MKKIQYYFTFFIVVLLITTINSQNESSLLSRFESDSKLWLDGTSTMHDFTITAKEIISSLVIDVKQGSDVSKTTLNISKLNLTIPVRALDSGKESMDENMQESLMMEDHPDIIFQLNSPISITLEKSDSLKIKAKGNLTVAGTKKSLDLDLVATKTGDKSYTFTGEKKILMSNFGIEPPSMFFGTLNTDDEIVIKFKVYLKLKS
jgi:polyisoprenoid-binding protein YceI